ncbi:hypothetical protein B0H17DRAFT_1070355 [Mycena rosella]|uniref:F-box domain-containing protein n=1 Tax=Mycena rosella TaxID=1033263 RepID=A0AAD7DB04_MYCRO|nr:hypothetical protein B0H17DRAFT_1070355 [Mycena rosella]
MLSPCRRKPVAEWLPNETIIEILQVVSRPDQVALCRVSKLFHALCLPYYIAFCSAIVCTPSLSQSVRSFKFIVWNSERDLGRESVHLNIISSLTSLDRALDSFSYCWIP